ncbi:TPA: primosomal protein N' [Candidatus Saccharibacteria bacterium]|nr:primosomal protein N' [Candidatus Saccharibacteria bacterium]HIO87192.1 primosomal protein N' [Candidatus Saccharibacteria bacterium]
MSNFYELIPLSPLSKHLGFATYHYDSALQIGDVVKVTYGKRTITALVHTKTSKPSFTTKPILETIFSLPPDLMQLISWISDYYSLSVIESARLVVPSKLHVTRRKKFTTPSATATEDDSPLTAAQKRVIKQIENTTNGTFLLHGVTGSGKTKVMLEVIKKTIQRGKDVILLVPEIGLSNQTLAILHSHGFNTVHMHSELSEAQRHAAWQAVATSDEPVVVLGPRSAVFSPVRHLGCVIIDEAHDASLKQDSSPYYDSVHIAAFRAKQAKAQLVLATATPNVTEQYYSETGRINYLKLPERIFKSSNHSISVVDRTNKQLFGRSKVLSDALIESIDTSTASKQLSLLFLNRRGHSPNILCSECGWKAECDLCSHPLTFHSFNKKNTCHICGKMSEPIIHCKNCGSSDVHYRGTGTQKLEQELKKLFPQARIERIDRDITSKQAFTYKSLLTNIADNKIDILIGTQLLTKGFDFPSLSTVGVVDADSMLYIPDFRSEELTFQMLTQVIGRNDRRGKGARTFIQTLNPQNKAITAALTENYQEFYEYEIKQRQEGFYPPFSYLLKITARRNSDSSAKNDLLRIKQKFKNINSLGPAPSMYVPAGKKQWHLIFRTKKRSTLNAIARQLESENIICNFDPLNLL